MQTYNVFYLVGDDTATLSFDADNLDVLFEILRKSEIDCILIYDADGKEVFREKGFMEYTTKSNPFLDSVLTVFELTEIEPYFNSSFKTSKL